MAPLPGRCIQKSAPQAPKAYEKAQKAPEITDLLFASNLGRACSRPGMRTIPMSNPGTGGKNREAARTRAQSHFHAAERRDEMVRHELAKERAASDAKTARLRALRLAKEEEDRIAAEAEALANPPKPKAKAKSKAAPKTKRAARKTAA